MSKLNIYDTKGNAYSPDGTATGTKEEIKDLFYAGVRLAIRSDHRQELTLFFRARETSNARTEQFYAVYSLDGSSAPLQDLLADLTARVESEWGYTIDDSSEEMAVFRHLKRNDTTLPGDSADRDILAELISSRNGATVGVSDERNAIGLLSEYIGDYDQAAIADSTDADTLSTFDLVVTPGRHRGITPLGATEGRWESTANSLRDRHIKQEITSIRDSVETLSRDFGLSNDEIRSRVHRSVPGLKPPATSSNIRSSQNQSDDDQLIPAETFLYVAVGAVVLLVLFAAVTYGPALLGAFGVVDTGGDSPTRASISGAVMNNTTGEMIDENTSNISVELSSGTTVLNSTAQPRYNFSVNEPRIAGAILIANADGYQSQRINISEAGQHNIRLEPATTEPESTTRSRVTGTIVNSTTSEGIASATVTLQNAETGATEAITGPDGTYTFRDVSFGEYTLSAAKSGYVTSDNSIVTIDSATTEVDDLKLVPNASLSVLYQRSNQNSTLSDGRVRLINTETDTVVENTSKGASAWYNNSNVTPGEYRLELTERNGYDDTSITFTLAPGEHYSREVVVQYNG